MQYKQKEEYRHSPGRFRQMERFPWTWDFTESHVREGHDCVSSEDRAQSRAKSAKLTFGEVLDSGVGRMLYNLGAHKKKTFHDLGMGPGKMLFQTYLMFPNLTTCMGVELSKGRYKLAEMNMTRLLKGGWRGREFLLVEFGQGFMKIVERSKHQHPADGFKVGDSVLAYKLKLRKHQDVFLEYSAKIVGLTASGKIQVEYENIGNTTLTLDPKYVFLPGTARVCEIWAGSLFDYPGNWDSDICILETDFPPDIHEELLEGMCSTPIGCTFLTYHNLRNFDLFPEERLRQLDVNVYDADRFLTSWSQGWRFYTWEHVADPSTPAPLPPNVTPQDLAKEDRIRVFNSKYMSRVGWSWAKVTEIREGAVEVTYPCEKTEIINLEDNQIALSRPRFKVGQKVMAHHPEAIKHKNTSLHPGTVQKFLPDGSFQVVWENEASMGPSAVQPHMAFNPPERKFKIGQEVLCCWTAYAVNKNSPERYRKFKARIEGLNNDGTYVVEFVFEGENGAYTESSHNVREMWITTEEEERVRARRDGTRHLEPRLSVCSQTANYWTPFCVSVLLLEASYDPALRVQDRQPFKNCIETVLQRNLDGKQLLAMKSTDLQQVLGMSTEMANLFNGRYLSFVRNRVDKTGSRGKRRRRSHGKRSRDKAPGGGVRKALRSANAMQMDKSDEKLDG